jgi:hypothetical protein
MHNEVIWCQNSKIHVTFSSELCFLGTSDSSVEQGVKATTLDDSKTLESTLEGSMIENSASSSQELPIKRKRGRPRKFKITSLVLKRESPDDPRSAKNPKLDDLKALDASTNDSPDMKTSVLDNSEVLETTLDDSHGNGNFKFRELSNDLMVVFSYRKDMFRYTRDPDQAEEGASKEVQSGGNGQKPRSAGRR